MGASVGDEAAQKMHELFTQVLGNKDLSRAGDLFSVSDSAIVNDLTQVLTEITSIASLPDYAHNDNDQSVVEICVTRVTSCIRETGSVEQHCEALVTLLESCLHHNLQPSVRDEDPPHAKISADIISCIFLNYSKKSVMERALPVAVKFLHKGNRELSRNMASYLSLAAIDHATLLSPHVQPIMDSIISGNYPLCRVLAQIYEVSHEPLQGHTMALVSLLPLCDNQEKLALLNLFSLIAKNTPELLEASVPQLCEYLSSPVTASATLQAFLQLAERRPTMLVDHVSAMKLAARRHPHTVCLAAQVIAAVGKLSKDKAQDALNFVLEHLPKADRGSQSTLLREATLLCSSYPVLFTDKVLAGVRQRHHHTSTNQIGPANNQINQTSGGVTIVKVGGNLQQPAANGTVTSSPPPLTPPPPGPPPSAAPVTGYTRRAKLGDSRSTGRLHTTTNTNTHRSMTRLNIAGGSVGGLHKSMTRLSSSQQINQATGPPTSVMAPALPLPPPPPPPPPPLSNNGVIVMSNGKWGVMHGSNGMAPTRVSSGGVTVTTISPPPRLPRPLSQGPFTLHSSGSGQVTVASHQINVNPVSVMGTGSSGTGATGSVTVHSMGHVSVLTTSGIPGNAHAASAPVPPMLHTMTDVSSANNNPVVSVSGPMTVTARRNNNNTSVTLLNANSQGAAAAQRMSVFEPYPMRDTVQHFCEKHLDKIKSYMDKVLLRIPSPAKCTIEERRSKKLAKLHFACQTRGQHCLYSRTFFTMRTRNPRIWIHLMFLALQARSAHALSSRDASVSSLKHCWDMLKCENKTFLTLVTSAFPCTKDQEVLLNELRHSGFFDVFQLSPASAMMIMLGSVGGGSGSAGGGGSTDQMMDTDGSSTEGSLQWGCFLCTHPERAVGFLRGNTQPVIEGQLKEKKGKWKLFRRWRTRYFTLSGAHLSCRGSSGGESIDVNQIRSVKVSRGARNIPKAFEIFTGNQSLIFKPKDGKNAEEWVQCLSIVVAHSHAQELPVKSNSLPARSMTVAGKIPI